MAAGSTKFPQTIWGSRIGEYLDDNKGTADDDGCIFTIMPQTCQINLIGSTLAALRNLVGAHLWRREVQSAGGGRETHHADERAHPS